MDGIFYKLPFTQEHIDDQFTFASMDAVVSAEQYSQSAQLANQLRHLDIADCTCVLKKQQRQEYNAYRNSSARKNGVKRLEENVPKALLQNESKSCPVHSIIDQVNWRRILLNELTKQQIISTYRNVLIGLKSPGTLNPKPAVYTSNGCLLHYCNKEIDVVVGSEPKPLALILADKFKFTLPRVRVTHLVMRLQNRALPSQAGLNPVAQDCCVQHDCGHGEQSSNPDDASCIEGSHLFTYTVSDNRTRQGCCGWMRCPCGCNSFIQSCVHRPFPCNHTSVFGELPVQFNQHVHNKSTVVCPFTGTKIPVIV
jgi:hypothetical protein